MIGMQKCWQFVLSIGESDILSNQFTVFFFPVLIYCFYYYRFLVQECHDLASSKLQISDFIRRRDNNKDELSSSKKMLQPFTLHEDVRIYMYCSEAPCELRPFSRVLTI